MTDSLSSLLQSTKMATTKKTNAAYFDKHYALERKLMSGSYGTVYVGLHLEKGVRYAVKVVDRR